MRHRRQLLFILPNLFTFSSVFCGLLSIHWSTSAEGEIAFYRSALAILFAAIFDMMDGRVARLTRTESEVGVQLDSLADVISFGVAPAILVYRWGLGDLYLGGFDLGFALIVLYVAAGAFRLARFNVLAIRAERATAIADAKGEYIPEKMRSAYFVGLPIPAAGVFIAALVFAHHHTDAALFQTHTLLAVIVPLLAWLMVSGVHYPTFKHVHFTLRTAVALAAALGLVALVTIRTAPAVTLALLIVGYVSAGLVAHFLGAPRRLAQRRNLRRNPPDLTDGDVVDEPAVASGHHE